MTSHDEFDHVEPPVPDLAAKAMRAELAAEMFGAEATRLRVGRYVLVELIGVGGMGIVYSAWDEELKRHVALKLLPAESVGSERERARLVREAQAMAQLSHPNVVTVYEVNEDAGAVFVAMERVDGQSLRQWQREQTRSVAETLDVYVQAGRGLSAAHHAGLVHRDFKPANVLVGTDGRVRVADFGLALGPGLSAGASSRSGDSSGSSKSPAITRTGAIAGTPAYMAPEQLAGSEPDARADQFSFCVSLFEALVGCRPYDKAGLRAARERSEAPVVARGQRRVPWVVRRALMRGLALEPGLRWPDMDTLLRAIHSRQAWRRRAVAWGGPVALGVGAAVMLRQPEPTPEAEVPIECDEPAFGVAQAWTAEDRKDIEGALRATAKPYWASVHRGLDAALDAHVERWEQAAHESAVSCRDGDLTQVRHAQTVACLERDARRFTTVVEVLRTAGSGVVDDPMAVLEQLEPMGTCESLAGALEPASELPPELADRLGRARILAAAGRGEEALVDIDSIVREQGPEMIARWSEIQATRGAVLASLERYDEASDALGKAAARAIRTQPLVAIEALRSGVGVALELEYLPLAEERVRLYEAVFHTLGASSSQEADFLDLRGRVRYEQGRLDIAAEDHARSLELRRVLDTRHPRYATTLLLAANVAAARWQLDQSDRLYNEALELRRSLLGPEHPRVAAVLFDLGLNAFTDEKFDDAERLFARAYDIELAAFGRRSTQAARTAIKLSEVRAELGQTQPALELAIEAWEVLRDRMPPGHSDRWAALRNLAEQQREAGNLAEALNRMLELVEERVTHGAGAPDSPDLSQNIAWLLCELEECRGAEFWNRIALSQLELLLSQSEIRSDEDLRGPLTLLQLYALNTQGTIELSRGRPRAALEKLEQVIAQAPTLAEIDPKNVAELIAEAEATAAKARRRL